MTPAEVTSAVRLQFGLVIDDTEAERIAGLRSDTLFSDDVDVVGRDIVSGLAVSRPTRMDELRS